MYCYTHSHGLIAEPYIYLSAGDTDWVQIHIYKTIQLLKAAPTSEGFYQEATEHLF